MLKKLLVTCMVVCFSTYAMDKAEITETSLIKKQLKLKMKRNAALFDAVNADDVDRVNTALMNGAEINSGITEFYFKESTEPSPLFVACQRLCQSKAKSFNVVNLLLKSGANPNRNVKKSSLLQTILCAATYHPDNEAVIIDLLKMLKNFGMKFTCPAHYLPVHGAISYGYAGASYNIIKYVLNQCPAVAEDHDSLDGNGKTPLMYVVKQAGPEKAKLAYFVICLGVNVDKRDKKGQTALMYAAKNKNTIFTKLLLIANGRTDLTDNKDRSALSHAVRKNWHNVDMIGLLSHPKEYLQHADTDPALIEILGTKKVQKLFNKYKTCG